MRRTDDRMQLFAQLEVFLLLLAGLVLREVSLDDSFDIAMSALLIILVTYVFCLFILHLFLFLRFKYKEMIRERMKAEALGNHIILITIIVLNRHLSYMYGTYV